MTADPDNKSVTPGLTKSPNRCSFLFPGWKQRSDHQLQICFPDRDRQRLFSHAAKLRSAYGEILAALIQCRLCVLSAAPHLGLVPADRIFDLCPEAAALGGYSVRLDPHWRLYFKAIDHPRQSKSLAAAQINHVQVVGVDRPSSKKVFKS